MHKFIPNSKHDKKEMLDVIGVDSIEDLFAEIPEKVRLKESLNLPRQMSEIQLRNHIKQLSKKNQSTDELVCFLGAGAYDHYIPSVVKNLTSRSEFYTSYTPYQPEISQGTLRGIFEFQTMITELTGLYASNASLYDGQTAVVEGAIMAVAKMRKRETVLVSKGVHPETRQVLKTYLEHQNIDIVEVELENGATSKKDLEEKMSKDVATVIIQSPNFFGVIEDLEPLIEITHEKKGLFMQSVDPMSLGLLKSPGSLGVDIAVGEGQCFGNGLNFGGPYLGFIATTKKLFRKLPGRIVGETEDEEGKRAYVLTLQAREQHIRRERATSNICSNQGLNALSATIYLSTVGKSGLKEVGLQCINKAHYAMKKIKALDGVDVIFDQPIFKEFAIQSKHSPEAVQQHLLEQGILGAYDLSQGYPELNKGILFAVTEKRTKEEIDALVKALEVM